jgi:hypothetical protein
MADVLRIKRRVSGSPGAPSGLANAELAYNEVDHTLYYGEGTGGAGGTATVVVPIGGLGIGGSIASNANPIMDGTAAPGVATLLTRGDHVHPSDTSRVAKSGDTMTGPLNLPAGSLATPAITFGTLQTGIFGIGTTTYFSSGGIGQYLSISPTVITNGAPAAFVPGSATASAMNFGTPGTGIYGDSGHVNMTVAGVNRFTLSNGNLIMTVPINLPSDPVNPLDAATKQYVDNVAQGLDAKQSVRLASTANITLNSLQTIDGVLTVAGDRVLLKDQTAPSSNGIYLASAGVWARALDADTWLDLPGAYTFIEEGTVNADTGWTCTVNQGGTIGTTAITWTQFSGAGQVVAGAGLTKTGNSIDAVGTANRISVLADSIDIASTYVGQSSITTLGTLNAVVITGGTIDGITFDMGTF